MTISRGWARARGRPWNDDLPDALLRLERGGQEFLSAATAVLGTLGNENIYSPTLYQSSTRIWAKCGYKELHRLGVMERSLALDVKPPVGTITETKPGWDSLAELDRVAFSGFWRMSIDGLREATLSTRRSVVLTAVRDSRVVGYTIVGAQWGVAYLQRIGVDPSYTGQNVGSDLVRAALRWARGTTAQVMVLNVREENEPALRLYDKAGFTKTSTSLVILRYAL